MDVIIQNIGTIVVFAAVVLLCILLAASLVKKQKNGYCSCGCSSCPMSAECKGNKNNKDKTA